MYGMPSSSFGQAQWRKDMGAEESEEESEEEEEEYDDDGQDHTSSSAGAEEAEEEVSAFFTREDASLEPPEFEKLWQSLPVRCDLCTPPQPLCPSVI